MFAPSEDRLAHQVEAKIEDLIAAGEYAVGSRLPGERELMKRLEVSRSVVREGNRKARKPRPPPRLPEQGDVRDRDARVGREGAVAVVGGARPYEAAGRARGSRVSRDPRGRTRDGACHRRAVVRAAAGASELRAAVSAGKPRRHEPLGQSLSLPDRGLLRKPGPRVVHRERETRRFARRGGRPSPTRRSRSGRSKSIGAIVEAMERRDAPAAMVGVSTHISSTRRTISLIGDGRGDGAAAVTADAAGGDS